VTAELRATVEQLAAPEPLREAVWAALRSTNLPAPARWEDAWTCIKRVWASVWNERAFLSRVARGLPHEALRMAVLIQEVVPARYAFVVHTVNPFTGNRDELYAEVVLGLGETLVGNFPGRALGFWCDKHGLRPRLLSFPAKSVGLYGRGLIFRSDSSGEDLPGFAGAGLYDSVLLPPARVELLDYRDEPLVWDEPFRDELLTTIARAGLAVEQVFGSPQDVEGAWTDGRCVVVQARPQVGLTAS
jgi:alpha-glucan,water dikinase